MNSLSVVIQAGGQSRRMGQDKALLDFHGQPLIQRVAEGLRSLSAAMFVTTADLQAYAFLGIPCVTDIAPGKGALGGLYTAMRASETPLVAVVACDMPFVNAGLLAYQRDLLLESDFDAAIPQTQAGIEPFHAVYRREALLPQVEAAIQQDQLAVFALFKKMAVRWISPAEIAPFDPTGTAFWNINTPEEYKLALENL